MRSPLANPAVERVYAVIRQRVREQFPASFRVNPVALLIIECREVFEVGGNLMQVEQRIPSGKDPHSDVILMRSYEAPRWNRNPYLQAVQVQTLERMIDEDQIAFPMGLGSNSHDFVSGWSDADLASLNARITSTTN